MRACSAPTAEGALWEVDAALRPEGKQRSAGAHAGQPRRLLRAVGEDLGVPGAAEGSARRRRPRARRGATSTRCRPLVWQAAERDGLRRPTCRRCAAGSRTTCPPAERRPPAQARPRRAARRRVRRAAAAAGARPRRRLAARGDHARRAGRAAPRRLRRPRGRSEPRRRLPVPAHARAPHPAVPAAPHPLCPSDEADLRRLGRSLGHAQRPAPAALVERSGSGTPARCAGCTRSCSTARCSTRSPGSPPATRA